jgi:hypothetical protein
VNGRVSLGRRCILLMVLVALSPAEAQAQYIDPGSSSLLWQLLVAGIVGLAFNLRHAFLALSRSLLSRRDKGSGKPIDDQ